MGAPAAGPTYQRTALERFLSDDRLPIHNNISEAALRREAVGRKNWIFVGSDEGARANTVFVSLLASCQMHDVVPPGASSITPRRTGGRVVPRGELARLFRRDTGSR